MKILINGILGKMGQKCLSRLINDPSFQLVGGTDQYIKPKDKLIVIEKDIKTIIEMADAVIDFSSSEGTAAALKSCLLFKKALIVGTTGLSAQLEKDLISAGEIIPVVRATNFSIGVNLLFDFVEYITSKLKNLNFDIELTEIHHRNKKDAPSGTAKTILDKIKSIYDPVSLNHIYGREGLNLNRDHQLGVHSIRGGSVIGTHEIQYLGKSENISIKHEALSRDVFVEGIILSLQIIKDIPNGYFTMKDILNISINK